MGECFPKDVKADTVFFVIIGDVLQNSGLLNVEVKPQTKMSECFAERLSRLTFPKPPDSFGEKGVPIVFDMKITP